MKSIRILFLFLLFGLNVKALRIATPSNDLNDLDFSKVIASSADNNGLVMIVPVGALGPQVAKFICYTEQMNGNPKYILTVPDNLLSQAQQLTKNATKIQVSRAPPGWLAGMRVEFLKPLSIRATLKAGFKILVMDPDVFCRTSPTYFLGRAFQTIDIACMHEDSRKSFNTGFCFYQPSIQTINFVDDIANWILQHPKDTPEDDQDLFNNEMATFFKDGLVEELSSKQELIDMDSGYNIRVRDVQHHHSEKALRVGVMDAPQFILGVDRSQNGGFICEHGWEQKRDLPKCQS